jgi:disulfide bond formation protein DsbB
MIRWAPFLVTIASLAVVSGALLFQYVGGLQPCELCLYQRWPYYTVAGFAFLATLVGERRVSRIVLGVAALLFLVDAGIAFYHTGVEQHWFAGPASCTGAALNASSAEELRAQLLATPPVRCDEIQWSLFGISLAGWNLVAALLLMIFSLVTFARLKAER